MARENPQVYERKGADMNNRKTEHQHEQKGVDKNTRHEKKVFSYCAHKCIHFAIGKHKT